MLRKFRNVTIQLDRLPIKELEADLLEEVGIVMDQNLLDSIKRM